MVEAQVARRLPSSSASRRSPSASAYPCPQLGVGHYVPQLHDLSAKFVAAGAAPTQELDARARDAPGRRVHLLSPAAVGGAVDQREAAPAAPWAVVERAAAPVKAQEKMSQTETSFF